MARTDVVIPDVTAETGPSHPTLGAPAGLAVDTFEMGGETFALLEWPVARPTARGGPSTGMPVPPGAPAQREVLDLLLRGLSNAEIARLRGRSERTVAHQVDRLYRRLRVGSRAELMALAAREGWIRRTS
jgi:DNA-binding CsgD family transcriptional regulator